MKLTPIDIEQQRFRLKIRGYDTREVQHFLEMVAQQTAALNRELVELKAELGRRNRDLEELRSREEGLKGAMLTAQKAIDDLRESAQKEAQLAISEAEVRAEKIVHSAHSKATEIHEEINDLRRQRVRFIEEIRGILNTHARLLDVHGAPPREASDPFPSVLDRLRPPTPPYSDDFVEALR